MVMHARDSARGLLTPREMLTLSMFTRRVVRSMPTADADVATRHRDGVRSAMAASSAAAAVSTATATTAGAATVATAAATTTGG